MAYEISREERYQKRAEEFRTIAEGMQSGEARKSLLDIAAEYDQLAQDARRNPDPNRPVTDP